MVFVPGGAHSEPGGKFVGSTAIVGSLTVVAQLVGGSFPERAMASSRACHGVRYFVEQHLVDFIILIFCGQVFGDGNVAVRKVAEACAGLGVIKSERPFRRIKVQQNEGIRPFPHTFEIGHRRLFLADLKERLVRRGGGNGRRVENNRRVGDELLEFGSGDGFGGMRASRKETGKPLADGGIGTGG